MNKNPFFQFNNTFIKEYMDDMREMMQEFQQEFGVNLESNLHNPSIPVVCKTSNFIPVELWETKDQLLILAYLAGVNNAKDVEILVTDKQTIHIKANYTVINPIYNGKLIKSELPEYLERDVLLPQPVKRDYFTKKLENCVLYITLYKEMEDFDLPIDF